MGWTFQPVVGEAGWFMWMEAAQPVAGARPQVNARAEQVKALGGQALAGPLDSPFGHIAVCLDPLGGHFVLICSAQGT